LAQNRKFQDFVETKYMADDAIGNAELENTMQKHAVFLYDATVQGGAIGAVTLTDINGNAATLPAHAVITKVTYDKLQAPASVGSATIALGVTGNTDAFKAATAFDNAAYTASATHMHNEIPLKVGAAAVSVLGTIATAALIAGKFRLIIEYTDSVLA
jgi:hypothetical protein